MGPRVTLLASEQVGTNNIAVVQRAKGQDNGGGTGSVSMVFGSNVTSGNAIVVLAIAEASHTTLQTPTDTRGNSYSLVFNNTNTTMGMKAWIAYNTGAGANTVAMGDGFNIAGGFAYEVSGLASSNAFDKSISTANVNTANPTSGATTTTLSDNQLLLSWFGSNATTGFNFSQANLFVNMQTQNMMFFSSAAEERIVTSPGVYASLGKGNTNGNTWTSMITLSRTSIGGGPSNKQYLGFF